MTHYYPKSSMERRLVQEAAKNINRLAQELKNKIVLNQHFNISISTSQHFNIFIFVCLS